MAKRVNKDTESGEPDKKPAKPKSRAKVEKPPPEGTPSRDRFQPASLRDFTLELVNQPLLEPIFRELSAGNSATIDGAWGSASGLAVAALAEKCPGVLLVALAHPRDLEPWRQELESFTGASPQIFPALNCLPGEDCARWGP